MTGTHNSFTPSTTTTIPINGAIPIPITLPAIDASNPAVLLQNLGTGNLTILAGTSSGGPIANAPGAIVLREGEAKMLLNSLGFGGATVATAQSASGGGMLAFSRGTATPVWLFAAAATVVI
jgi:hypothetical protein